MHAAAHGLLERGQVVAGEAPRAAGVGAAGVLTHPVNYPPHQRETLQGPAAGVQLATIR